MDAAVIEAVTEAMQTSLGNPHSDEHAFGWRAHQQVETARAQIAKMINGESDEIFFTSGATESNNLALLGLAQGISSQHNAGAKKCKILVSDIEHKCVLMSAQALTQSGWCVEGIPVSVEGIIDIESFDRLLTDDVAMVSVMTVNNEVGTQQPVQAIAERCREREVFFHTDAAQAPLATKIDVSATGIDLLSLSSHKMYGPKGIGALYIAHHVQHLVKPLLYGGGQEQALRPGTLPTPLCVGFGVAASLVNTHFEVWAQQTREMRDLLWRKVQASIRGVRLNGSMNDRHPGNLNIYIPDVDANLLIGKLQPSVAISSGSACNAGVYASSYVLNAMGLSSEVIDCSVRVGIGKETTEQQINDAVKLLETAVDECHQAVA